MKFAHLYIYLYIYLFYHINTDVSTKFISSSYLNGYDLSIQDHAYNCFDNKRNTKVI